MRSPEPTNGRQPSLSLTALLSLLCTISTFVAGYVLREQSAQNTRMQAAIEKLQTEIGSVRTEIANQLREHENRDTHMGQRSRNDEIFRRLDRLER